MKESDFMKSNSVQVKGERKQNPWIDSQALSDLNLEKSTAQVVQSLPPSLAQDAILKSLLQPNFGQVKLEGLSNVIPIDVNYGGVDTQTADYAIQGVHKDQKVKYDPNKGVVTSSWSNFVLPKDDQSKLAPDEGIVIKHLTSTIFNPAMLAKGKVIQGGINVDSISVTSPNLMQNNWTNVLLYTPKEQVINLNVDPNQSAHPSSK